MIFNIPPNVLKQLREDLSTINFANIVNDSQTGLDLDTYTNGGTFYFTGAPENRPDGAPAYGYLIVVKRADTFVLTQYWIYPDATNSAMWMRTNTDSPVSWGAWKKLITDADLDDLVWGTGTNIPENADLNDYTTPGVYHCSSSTTAQTLSNTPHTTTNFKLIVCTVGSSDTANYIFQIILTSSSANGHDVITRNLHGGTWHEWRGFAHTPIKTTASLASGSKSWTWSNTDITASNSVFVSPAPASYAQWVDNRVRCSAQTAGKLTFTADTNTTAAITVNVVIIN